jgi:hypothetical protein
LSTYELVLVMSDGTRENWTRTPAKWLCPTGGGGVCCIGCSAVRD